MGYMRIDFDGEEQFRKLYGNPQEESLTWGLNEHCELLENDEIVSCGARRDWTDSVPNPEALLVKFDGNGDTLWLKTYPAGKWTRADDVIRCSSGGFAICGQTRLTADIQAAQTFLIRTDEQGNFLWRKEYGAVDIWEFGVSLVEHEEGGFFISGARVTLPEDLSDHYLIKVDSLGILEWEDYFGNPNLDNSFNTVSNTSDANYLLAGSETLGGTEDNEERVHRLRKFDIDGNIIWETTGGAEPFWMNSFTKAREDFNGDYVCVGMSFSDTYYLRGGCLAKFEPVYGDQLWFHKYTYVQGWDPLSYHEMWDFAPLPNGGYALVGWVTQSGNTTDIHSQDIWLLAVDEDGCLEPGCLLVGIEEQVIGLQETLKVFPNPLPEGADINIRFEQRSGTLMPYAQEDTEISIFDMNGRLVKRELLPATGSHAGFNYTLSSQSLQSGTYLLHWSAGERWFDSVNFVVE
jgi:hypothetical protein